MLLIKLNDFGCTDSDFDELNTAKVALIARIISLCSYALDVNDTLTIELERYKEQVKVLKEGQIVDLKSKDNISDSCEQSVEIDRLKQTISKHLKETESLIQTVTLLKHHLAGFNVVVKERTIATAITEGSWGLWNNIKELVQETTDKVVVIRDRLKVARDHQKSYADNRRKPLEFQVGDHVMLKVSPCKGVVRCEKKGKLAPRFVGPFEILERIGPMAYRLRLHEELSSIKVDKTLRFVEEPLEIMDLEVKTLKRSKIPIVKVRWNSKRGPEFTWERKDHMKAKYPQLFENFIVETNS
ncbi:hypothetical protein Tco_1022695 [Tanacetum coccineum]